MIQTKMLCNHIMTTNKPIDDQRSCNLCLLNRGHITKEDVDKFWEEDFKEEEEENEL